MVFKRTAALTSIADGLGTIAHSCEHLGLLKLFDNNRIAQHFFRRFLNRAFDLELVEMDRISPNYPAIDLGDANKKIAYQVTTEKKSDKVQSTLDKFAQHELNETYDRLIILIVGRRQETYKKIEIPESLSFDCDRDIIDIPHLLKTIDGFDTDRLVALQEILEDETAFHSAVCIPTRESQLAGLSIDIGVERDPPSDGLSSEWYPADRILRYTLVKTTIRNEQQITISPDLDYLKVLASGSPVEAINFFHNPFRCHYPNLDVTFVNNCEETLAVTEAIFEVAESIPDSSPIIVFKDNNARMKLAIDNEGWGIVRNATLKFNLLPTGATEIQPDPPISHLAVAAPFSHEISIGDFEDSHEIDLEPVFEKFGVDVEMIKSAAYRSQQMTVLYAMQNGLDTNLYKHYGRFPKLDNNDAWKQFPDGYAVVAGLLEYDNVSTDGISRRCSLPFRVRVFLFNIRSSLPRPPSYQYNAMLEPEGKKYEVFCPVSHSLASGEVDRIRIRVACERSANHMLRIKWVLNGGRESVSSPIVLKHFVPKAWSRQTKMLRSVGDGDNIGVEGRSSSSDGMGCVEASLLLAMQLARANGQMDARDLDQQE